MAGERYWAIVPAAGKGRRMSEAAPKQYLPLAGRTVIEWAIEPLLARANLVAAVVAVAEDDSRFKQLSLHRDSRIRTVVGGAERVDSVRHALQTLDASEHDWVLVHDAARPCLHGDDVDRLVAELRSDEVGGLLAAPVVDTLKLADNSYRVSATQSRANLWRALTPQMFRFGVLSRALHAASGKAVTDEAAAVEMLGRKPKLVVGRADNIKITVAEDLPHAEFILRQRQSAAN